VFFEKDF